MITEFYKERTYSLASIRRLAQNKYAFNESSCTGINHLEVLNALNQLGLSHYRASFGVDGNDIWNMVATGPVIVGVYYGKYPNWSGHCTVPHAEVAGRTDCGFRGAHAVLAIGRRWHNGHKDIMIRDPDHHSPSRPERPAYDRINTVQLNTAMRALVPYTPFTNTYCVYPTRRK